MNNIPIPYMLLLVLLASLMGCATGDPSSSSPTAGEPAAPSPSTEQPAAAPSTVTVPSKETTPPATNPQGHAFSHKPPRDTMEWESTNISGVVPAVKETDREWVGERLGLIGPIIAKGGVGSKRYVTVYDSAGVLIGAMTYAEYEKSPQRLAKLLQKAQMRTEHQNLMALRYLIQKRMAAEAAAIYKEQGGPP